MRTGTATRAELAGEGTRLQAGFHLSEDQRAVARLSKLAGRCVPLGQLVEPEGLFTGSIFKRVYASGADHGRPYVSPSELLKVEVRSHSFLSPLVGSDRLDRLALKPGTVLVTCSGMNLGQAVWCRPDMDGLIASHDLIRVELDASRVPAGYVYAYLAGRFGHAWIRKQIYGGNIKHVEAKHLEPLPVPRLDPQLEVDVDAKIRRFADLVASYRQGLDAASQLLFSRLGVEDIDTEQWRDDPRHLGWVHQGASSMTLRALNHHPVAAELAGRIRSGPHSPLGELCRPDLFKGKIIFKRIDAEAPYAVMLLGQRNAFRLRPYGRMISKASIQGIGLQVPPLSTMIPSHGTLGEGELYCRAFIVTSETAKYAYSGDFFRCIPVPEKIPPGYLFAFLRSETAFRLLRSISAGGKQQEQHPALMWRLPIPRLKPAHEQEIHERIVTACEQLDKALLLEEQARSQVERAVKEAH